MRTLSSAGDVKLIWCCLRGVDEAAQTTDAHSSIDGLDGALELLAIHDVAPRRLARWKVALHLKAQAVQHRWFTVRNGCNARTRQCAWQCVRQADSSTAVRAARRGRGGGR